MTAPVPNTDDPAVVSAFDELPLWSAPFGLRLLETVHLAPNLTVLDVGFGTGFPLLELARRLDAKSRLYGVDPWAAGTDRARDKLRTYGLTNVLLLRAVAEKVPLRHRQRRSGPLEQRTEQRAGRRTSPRRMSSRLKARSAAGPHPEPPRDHAHVLRRVRGGAARVPARELRGGATPPHPRQAPAARRGARARDRGGIRHRNASARIRSPSGSWTGRPSSPTTSSAWVSSTSWKAVPPDRRSRARHDPPREAAERARPRKGRAPAGRAFRCLDCRARGPDKGPSVSPMQ